MILFLCGDVMTGRGIDQILPQPGHPRLHEFYVRNAARYVEIAEQVNGPIPRPVAFSYIWGDALDELARIRPDPRIINLETAITTSESYWPDKGIHYRMHPANLPCIQALGVDCCVLANNHAMDWGHAGLVETLNSLDKANIKTAGAGLNAYSARSPVELEVAGKGRVLVFGFGCKSSGIPDAWAATDEQPGINVLPDLSDATVREIGTGVRAAKKNRDVVIASIHWGGNWGYDVPKAHREFAHRLIDVAGVDVIHGHSSHHPLGIGVYRGKLILYGCGDFLNDYEGISGYEEFRGDLTLMYFPAVDPVRGTLQSLEMVPLQLRRFRLNRPSTQDMQWIQERLDRECRRFGSRVERSDGNRLSLRWA